MTTWLRAIRVHQWAKNGLLLLPAMAAHRILEPATLATLAVAFVSFSLLASSVYLLNDLVDLEHDRAHPVKRNRPLAAGELSSGAALAAMGVFAAVSLVLALRLPLAFLGSWLGYLLMTVGYSFLLKRIVVLDVVVLAALYTVRVVAGAAAVALPLSRWFLAFSVFLFLSLGILKRAVEMKGVVEREGDAIRGRGWEVEDLPVLYGLGAGSAVAATLVYCLYITGEEVRALYDYPDVLWVGLPVLLYWLGRVWVLAERGEVHEDPLLFALRDRVSYAVLLVLAATLVLAT